MLADLGCEFRIAADASDMPLARMVDIVRGIHAMIPKSLFSGDLRQKITIV